MWQLGLLLLAGLVLAADSNAPIVTRGGQRYACKCYPGDSCYPTTKDWTALNTTVQGNLQVALPPAAPCYQSVDGIPTFDATQCSNVLSKSLDEQWTTDQPIANLWTFWTNETCPFTGPNPGASCSRGYYGNYVILAKTRAHIKAGVDFARNHNLRLIIRNTGHDFLGRSVGYGSLVINTHSFKEVQFFKNWKGKGGAVKVGAALQVRELYRLANKQNPPVVVVGGECPTVGFAGGYIQGGGHGPMASFYGMAADQALEFEVLTANGQFLTANQNDNSDLFWALKGGGPSTFAVVLSVTVKTFPEVPSAGIILNINNTHTTDLDVFWKGVSALHDLSNHWVDHGMFVYYELGGGRFHVQPIVGPNMTAARITQVAKPLFDKLKEEGIPYSTVTKEFPTFFDLYIDMFEDEGSNASALVGGRLFTKQDIASNAKGIVDAYRFATDSQNAFIIGHIVGPGFGAPVVDNAVHPTWRKAASFSITSYTIAGSASLQEKATAQNIVTNVIGNALRDASPHGAAYVNEGDLEEPNWQEAYWGSNYKKLYALKNVWDPLGVLYARTTPGTEDWEVIDDGTRLCKKI